MKYPSVVLIIMAVLLSACSVNAALSTEEKAVAVAAGGIAELELPEGYAPELTASVGNYTVVSYTPGDGYSHLYLAQSVDPADEYRMEQALDEVVPGGSDPEFRMTVLETRPVVVRGTNADLVISEGTNSDGEKYLQALVAFDGRGGPALLVFSEPAATWDMEKVEALVASIS